MSSSEASVGVAATGDRSRQPTLLKVHGAGKAFARRGAQQNGDLQVLENVSFNAHPGEFVTIIGPSGCGKSTLLNCIAGLTKLDEGTISVAGEVVDGPGPDRAMVFQQASLLPWRTVAGNVEYGLQLRRGIANAERAARVAAALELVGLTEFAAHFPHEISGGMQQRANVARALAVEADLVLMDEPFGALDAMTKETLQDELSAIGARTQRTVVFITHDIDEAVFLGDRVLVMAGGPGRIIADIEVPFTRPRSRDVTESNEFTALVHELRAFLKEA